MTIPRLSQKTVTQVIDVMQWTLSGDDAEAAEETRRQCRLSGPYCAAYLTASCAAPYRALPSRNVCARRAY
jgi:hypothetical protein